MLFKVSGYGEATAAKAAEAANTSSGGEIL